VRSSDVDELATTREDSAPPSFTSAGYHYQSAKMGSLTEILNGASGIILNREAVNGVFPKHASKIAVEQKA
jgi:hypothetical protein